MLGEFKVTGIQCALKGIAKIDVTFDIDENGILKVSAQDINTKAENSIEVEFYNDRLS